MENNITYTITFGDCAENHIGMQKIGNEIDTGFTYNDLLYIRSVFNEYDTELINLKNTKFNTNIDKNDIDDAYILIVRNGLKKLLNGYTLSSFFNEQYDLKKDEKALMYGRVVNKVARHNLCFGENQQKPDYKNGKGTIIAFDNVPILNNVRNNIINFLPNLNHKLNNIVAEGNYYYDIKKCYIGYHGDTERKIVIGVRIGATFPLYFKWFLNNKNISEPIKLLLNTGDIYFMDVKTTGNDWKKRKIPTLRHSAGINIKY